jgi:hypothetical protein
MVGRQTPAGGTHMPDNILEKMKRGVYYPGHHLGTREELERLVAQGYLKRMDASFICGPDSEPAYCLSEKRRTPTRKAPTNETDR